MKNTVHTPLQNAEERTKNFTIPELNFEHIKSFLDSSAPQWEI